MFLVDHGEPGSITLPEVLDPGRTFGTPGYAVWAEHARLVATAEQSARETRRMRRLRHRADALHRRADRADALVRRQERFAG